MTVATFEDLSSTANDGLRDRVLDALYALYYGDSATAPGSLDRFETELRAALTAADVNDEDAAAVTTILVDVIRDRHGSAPDTFAAHYLSDASRLDAADHLSDVTDWFAEHYLDPATGRYYDAEGNWYDENQQPITADSTPEQFWDEQAGLFYDAEGNWYDGDHRPLEVAANDDQATQAQTEQAQPGQIQPEQIQVATDELTRATEAAVADLLREQPDLAAVPADQLQEWISGAVHALIDERVQAVS